MHTNHSESENANDRILRWHGWRRLRKVMTGWGDLEGLLSGGAT